MADLFAQVVGHAAIVDFLRRELDQPAQAYLFVGPSGVGKGTVAAEFAAGLIAGGDDDVIGKVRRGSHPDLVVIEPEGRASITVDQARSTVSQASLAPLVSSRKVFLIPEASSMNDEAANALLKTLEEPTRSTVFVLVAEAEDDLPITVASRSRTVVFGRIADENIVEGLVAKGVEKDQALRAARIAGGRPGLAIALATQPAVADFRKTWLEVPKHLSGHPGDSFLLADQVMSSTEPLLETLKQTQLSERQAVGDDIAGTRAFKERQERDLKRATAALYTTGLEILAGFYRDTASAQLGAGVRNPDIPPAMLTTIRPAVAVANVERIMVAIEALESNQRPVLAFTHLFADLGSDTP